MSILRAFIMFRRMFCKRVLKAMQHPDGLLHEMQGQTNALVATQFLRSVPDLIEVIGDEEQSSRLLLCEATRKAPGEACARHACHGWPAADARRSF